MVQPNDQPIYRPFTTPENQFHIGLNPLDRSQWIETGSDFADQLKAKHALLRTRHGEVFAALPGSVAAQHEVLDALIDHLTGCKPARHRLAAGRIDIPETGQSFQVGDFTGAPLDLAGRIVPEDLCILEQNQGRYCLTAASLCAPAYWRLKEKIGKPMTGIHAPVPGWRDRLGPRVDRIFDRLRCAAPVWRLNWSIVPESHTFTPFRSAERQAQLEDRISRAAGDELYLRVERQTLMRMPRTEAILFTIRTYVTRLDAVIDCPDDARALRVAISALGEKEKTYKDLDRISGADWDRLLGPAELPEPKGSNTN